MCKKLLILSLPLMAIFLQLLACSPVGKDKNRTAKKLRSDINLPFENPFANLQYDRIVSYNYNHKAPKELMLFSILDKNKNLHKSHSTGKVLSQEESEKLLNIVLDTTTYRGNFASCFDPRWAFVFYKGDNIVGSIDICFECNYLHSSQEIKATIGHSERPGHGFSKMGRQKLQQLCTALKMEHCGDSDAMFD